MVGRLTHHAFFPVALLYLMVEDDGLVDIDGGAVPLCAIGLETGKVPIGRHGNAIPCRTVIVHAIELLGTILGGLGEMELPNAVKRMPARTVFGQYPPRVILWGKGCKPCTGLQLVIPQKCRRLPFLTRRGNGVAVMESL